MSQATCKSIDMELRHGVTCQKGVVRWLIAVKHVLLKDARTKHTESTRLKPFPFHQ